MLELGILAALGAMLSWGIGDFLIQRTVRRIGDIESLAIIGIIGAVGMLPFVAAELPLLLEPANLALLGFLGAVNFGVSAVGLEALRRGKLSLVEVVMEIELPVTIVLAFVVFGETLGLLQLGLIAAVFLGIVLIALEKSMLSRRAVERGLGLALVTAVGFGVVNFLTAAGARHVSPLMAIWLPWVAIACLGTALIARREGARAFTRNVRKHRKLTLAMGVVDTTAWIFYAFAAEGNPVGIVTAIGESYPAIGVMLGLWVNKERVAGHQLLGGALAILASIGLAVIA